MEDNTRKKLFLVQAAAIGVGVLILLIWIFNLKNVWRANGELAAAKEQSTWQALQADLTKTLADVSNQLNQVENNQTVAQETVGRNFLSGLLQETKKIASTTAASSATTTATTTVRAATSSVIKNKNCPAWVNCMPTLVGPNGANQNSCQVPVGCEGITQKAY